MAPYALQKLKLRHLRSSIGFAVVIGASLVAAIVHFRQVEAMQVRLLMADPDRIPNDAALLDFAMPRGRAAYEQHCAQCHGVSLRGDARRGIPDLADADWLYGTGRIAEIERIVLYGIRTGHSKSQNLASMPAFGMPNPYPRYRIEPLTRHELDDVAALIYAFQHRSEVDPAAAQRGSEIYHGKGLCFDCHGDHATGDPAIGAPNLTDQIWLVGNGSLEQIKAAIAWGDGGVCPLWLSRLSPLVIRAIAVYVHTASTPAIRVAQQ